jgi:hypothetical protein
VSDDHSSFDELADLDEGLLEPSRADEVRAHLVGCAACRTRHQALRTVHDELAVLPPETMPPAVVQRVDRALAAAAIPRSATVVPIAQHVRRRPWPALAGVAAGVVVVGFLAAVVVGSYGGGSSGGSGTSSAGSATGANGLDQPRAAGHYTLTVSPKTYTHDTVPSGISRLVGTRLGTASVLPSSPGSAANQPAISGTVAGVPKPLLPLYHSPTKLLNCAATVARVPGSLPEAVVFGHYTSAAGKKTPSVFFVFSDGAGRADIDVVGPSCAGLDQSLDFFQGVTIK